MLKASFLNRRHQQRKHQKLRKLQHLHLHLQHRQHLLRLRHKQQADLYWQRQAFVNLLVSRAWTLLK
ncbi:hypothetical protein D3C79_1032140 [compost metagenome]